MYTFLDIVNVDRTFHYETHFVRKNDCNDKLLKDEETFIMFSQNKVFFNYKINIFVVHFRDGWRGGGSGKAYLLYTCENVDNYEQPLNMIWN